MTFEEINAKSIENVQPGMGPQLQPGEKMVLAGVAATPVPGWSYLLLASMRNMMRTNRTYLVIATNQRLVLAKGSLWTNKITAENFHIKQEVKIADIRDLMQRGEHVTITTSAGVLKLEAVRQLVVFGTHPDFMAVLFGYLKAEVLKLEQAQNAPVALA